MSRSNNSQSSGSNYRTQQGGSNRPVAPRPPCCPHCSNLNKYSEVQLPTNHFLRETPAIDSKLVCPVLLATECRYCKKFGHTVSRCPVSAENKRRDTEVAHNRQMRDDSAAAAAAALEANRAKQLAKSNHFSALDSDSDEDAHKPVAKVTIVNKKRKHESEFDFPELVCGGESAVNSCSSQLNFMCAILKEPTAVPVVKEKVAVKISDVSPFIVNRAPHISSCWADSDSDDEETESDYQRKKDEHTAWLESKRLHLLQQNPATLLKQQNPATLLLKQNPVEPDESVDSW